MTLILLAAQSSAIGTMERGASRERVIRIGVDLRSTLQYATAAKRSRKPGEVALLVLAKDV
jgi:hypothetical protein